MNANWHSLFHAIGLMLISRMFNLSIRIINGIVYYAMY